MLEKLNPVILYGGAGATLILYILILRNWKLGIYLLLLALPFVGVAVTLMRSQLPLLALDILLIFPVYLSFIILGKCEKAFSEVPQSIILLISLFIGLVLVQSFNPNSFGLLMAAVGIKVWLLYLPLVLVGIRMASSEKELRMLILLVVVPSIVPCVLGIFQWFSCNFYGYEKTMEFFYRDQAFSMTQGFERFNFGITIFRIPSTFRYMVQYSNYTLFIISASFALYFLLQKSLLQKHLFRIFFLLAILASFLSGARAMFIFTPMLLLLIYWNYKSFKGTFKAVTFISLIVFTALFFSDLEYDKAYETLSFLLFHYGEKLVMGGFVTSIVEFPFGKGTGMNTGPARHVVPDGVYFDAFENYYAKAIIELGILGFILLALVFIFILVHSYRIHRALKSRKYRATSAALISYISVMMINSFKGWPLDLTPSNVYFWLFIGVHFSLLRIENSENPSSFNFDISDIHQKLGSK